MAYKYPKVSNYYGRMIVICGDDHVRIETEHEIPNEQVHPGAEFKVGSKAHSLGFAKIEGLYAPALISNKGEAIMVSARFRWDWLDRVLTGDVEILTDEDLALLQRKLAIESEFHIPILHEEILPGFTNINRSMIDDNPAQKPSPEYIEALNTFYRGRIKGRALPAPMSKSALQESLRQSFQKVFVENPYRLELENAMRLSDRVIAETMLSSFRVSGFWPMSEVLKSPEVKEVVVAELLRLMSDPEVRKHYIYGCARFPGEDILRELPEVMARWVEVNMKDVIKDDEHLARIGRFFPRGLPKGVGHGIVAALGGSFRRIKCISIQEAEELGLDVECAS
jgi:hypothetical protein